MKIDTMPKKILAGATAVVALSGFVPAINAASPTATANVGVSVVIQQAITINVGAPVNFGTIILSASVVNGGIFLLTNNSIVTNPLTGEVSLAGGHAIGTMAINQSAGAVNIALGAAPTEDGGKFSYPWLKFGGTALASFTNISGSSNKTVNLIGSVLNIGGKLEILSKPTPGTYTGKSYAVTVTDI